MEEETLGKPIWADPKFICFIHHKITFAWCSKLKYGLADSSRGIGTKNVLVNVWERMWDRQRWIVLILASSCNILYLLLSCALGTGIYCSYSLLVQLSLATTGHKRPRPHQDLKLPLCCCVAESQELCPGLPVGLSLLHLQGWQAGQQPAHPHITENPTPGTPTWITPAPHTVVLLLFHQFPPISFLVLADNTCSD